MFFIDYCFYINQIICSVRGGGGAAAGLFRCWLCELASVAMGAWVSRFGED